MRHKRTQWTFLLLASAMVALLTIGTIALVNPSGPSLSPAQDRLLEILAGYQRQFAASKLVIGRENGEVFPEPTPPNLSKRSVIRDLYGGTTPTDGARFEQLLESMPQQYIRIMNEARYDNPFVVQVTEAGLTHALRKR